MTYVINKCEKRHYFLKDVCPFCEKRSIGTRELRKGDCVKCGQLCADGAYACYEPSPIRTI
jgi:ribosomal protein L37AE/L43A